MKPDTGRIVPSLPIFCVLLGAVLLVFLSPFPELFLIALRQGVNLIPAMPQIVWWLIMVTILIIWGIRLLFRLADRGFSRSARHRPAARSSTGSLSGLSRSLKSAGFDAYAQDQIRHRLSSLAIDLISLKLDIPEREARERFLNGDWTEDDSIKTYLSSRRDKQGGGGLRRLFKKPTFPLFLSETGDILNRLDSYRHSIDGGKIA